MNPFSPTFGASPPLLAGRDAILEDFSDALEAGPSHPNYTTLYLGARGAGKTVILNAVEDLARSQGWLTISDNASPAGLLERIRDAAEVFVDKYSEPDPERRIKGLRAPGGAGVEFEITPSTDDSTERPLRTVLTELGYMLAERSTGLFITLDELQSAALAEVREFGAVIQHVTRREQLPVAFAGAGLPQIEDTLLADDAATFLQRCARYDIDFLDAVATSAALLEPIDAAGGSITSEALRTAVDATSGYPFMIQLIGFHSWKAADGQMPAIAIDHVTEGIAEAESRLGRQVLEPIWRGLSDVDRQFLLAMSLDSGDSRISNIAARMDVSLKYASVYRQRLISAGMITPAGRGRLRLAHHTARDWLRTKTVN